MKGPKKQPKKEVIIERNKVLLRAYGWREFTSGGWTLDGTPDLDLIQSLQPKLSTKQMERQKRISSERLTAFENKLKEIIQNSNI